MTTRKPAAPKNIQSAPPVNTPEALRIFLKNHPFVYVYTKDNEKPLATLHSNTRLLWTNSISINSVTLKDSLNVLKKSRHAGLVDWSLPDPDDLELFAKSSNNPWREGRKYLLRTITGKSSSRWFTNKGCLDVDTSQWRILQGNATGNIFACHTLWVENTTDVDMLNDLVQRGWLLRSATNSGVVFDASESFELAPASIAVPAVPAATASPYTRLDYTPCRLPELSQAQLNDPEKGLWELWGKDPSTYKSDDLVARDPGRDVQDGVVAIDFGTSSTVVAINTPTGGRELLRIGVRDFYQAVKARDFENPTVLECVDYPAFAKAWGDKAYRPELNWDWMRAAHEAQAHFRDNPGDRKMLSSVLPLLKQWALRTSDQRKRLTDQQTPAYALELAPHAERNPVRGQPLTVSTDDAFDPIELYAWYLGMAINWRGRGLFMEYYLSFPVKYPKEVKERILASFRRGLQRSLPQTLIEHHHQVLNDFEVNELATEPAAYAAAALEHLGIQPTEDGVPYAVFDFGGGTTDFDYGLLRMPTPEEADQGYLRVLEHLGSSGDNFLGGENLLEHLVYESFKHNLPMLREKRIQFTQPLDAQPFPGSEAFLSKTLAAQTNTVMLAAKLRSFLESDQSKLESTVNLNLSDENNNSQKNCELVLSADHLDTLLFTRISQGVEAFLSELARLRPQLPVDAPIHVLLSGNGSRSRHIKALFDTNGPLWEELLTTIFGADNLPDIVVHAPMPLDDAQPHAPTAKTGVALGMLRLAPGENTLLHNRLHTDNDGEAPFGWYVGRMGAQQFVPILIPGTTYYQWKELGPLQQGVFNLYTSKSPRAHSLKDGDQEMRKHRMKFPAVAPGARLYGRAIKPHVLEVAAATDESGLQSEGLSIKTVALE